MIHQRIGFFNTPVGGDPDVAPLYPIGEEAYVGHSQGRAEESRRDSERVPGHDLHGIIDCRVRRAPVVPGAQREAQGQGLVE